MPYNVMLQKIIAEANYSQSDIIRECEKINIHIDKSNFNKILSGKRKPPKVEISKAIAKICNTDERRLILESYFDNAPEEIKQIFKNIQYMLYIVAINFIDNNQKEIEEYIGTIDDIKSKLEKEPLSDILIQMLDNNNSNIDFINNNFEYIDCDLKKSLQLKDPLGIEVLDDGMSPMINSGDKITIELKNTYNTSDIVYYISKKDIAGKVRMFSKYNNTVIMLPLNQNYKIDIYNSNDIQIIGKVSNVIKSI